MREMNQEKGLIRTLLEDKRGYFPPPIRKPKKKVSYLDKIIGLVNGIGLGLTSAAIAKCAVDLGEPASHVLYPLSAMFAGLAFMVPIAYLTGAVGRTYRTDEE